MKNIEIIRATLDDIDQLQKISRETFYESFASGNTEENMKTYLDQSFSEERLTAEMSDDNSEFYFAMLDGAAIGYLKINKGNGQTEIKDSNGLEIERIYVYRQFHGQHLGKLLFEKAMEIARQGHADYVWLGVWEENARAINFYKKNGFIEFDKHIFKLGNDEQTDIMMKRQLS